MATTGRDQLVVGRGERVDGVLPDRPVPLQAAAKELLGEDFGSFIITDRYAGYHWLDVLQQQLCWCHAIRQFVSLSERDGAPGGSGTSCSQPPIK